MMENSAISDRWRGIIVGRMGAGKDSDMKCQSFSGEGITFL